MPTNHYFSNYTNVDEQRLIENLIIESIKIMGFEAYYLPNTNDQARDLLYGEDPIKKFQSAFPIEMYLSTTNEHTGEREFFSKFGLQIKNGVSVIVARRSFAENIIDETITRPREGDLVYVPFLNGQGDLYEIKFVNQAKDFYMLGRQQPYFYELDMEKFKFSQETITTGISDIDNIVTDSAYTLHLTIGSGSGAYTLKELVFQSADGTYANATTIGTAQAWNPAANTLSVTNISGEFVSNNIIIGTSSNARYRLVTFDPINSPAIKEVYDNQLISQSADTFVNFSETNPFGDL